MELLTITLAANETKQFARAGRYFEIIASDAAINVAFYGLGGGQTDSMMNALSGLFLEDPYAAFSITNSGAAQSITLLLMETGRGGSRRQPGVVSVVDQGAYKSGLGKQFVASFTRNSSSGAVGVVGGLKADTGSFAVKRLMLSSTTAGVLGLYFGSAAPTVNAGTTAQIVSKLATAPVATASRVYGDAATGVPTGAELPGVALIANVQVGANAYSEVPLTTPLILPQGYVLAVASLAVNRDVSMVFDFEAL